MTDPIYAALLEGLFSETVVFPKNYLLKEGGSIDTNIYFIEEGSLRIFVSNQKEEQTIRLGYKNNIIGALDSFFNEKPSDFYIETLKKTTIRIAKKADFIHYISQNRERLLWWQKRLEDLILQQIDREKDLLMNTPKERYENVLKRSPALFQEIPHKHIANYLRMAPETLSRLKKS